MVASKSRGSGRGRAGSTVRQLRTNTTRLSSAIFPLQTAIGRTKSPRLERIFSTRLRQPTDRLDSYESLRPIPLLLHEPIVQTRHSAEALLIDPDREDTQLFLDALEDDKIANHVHTVSSGGEALDFLHQRSDYSDTPRPNLILLDVDLPEMDGHELLETLTGDPGLDEIAVIVLTGSTDAEAVAHSYDLHANAYVRKPVDPDEFIDVVRDLENFWLEIVWLPPDTRDGQ